MPCVPISPMRKSAGAHQALLTRPADEQRHADARPQAQDLDRAFVPDAQTIFKGRAVQPLMQPAFDSPIFPIGVQKCLGRELLGTAAGDQVFHFELGLLATLAVQTADLRRPGQAQLDRFNRAGRQRAPFAPAAIVLAPDHLRGKRSPAGGVGRFPGGRFGCL